MGGEACLPAFKPSGVETEARYTVEWLEGGVIYIAYRTVEKVARALWKECRNKGAAYAEVVEHWPSGDSRVVHRFCKDDEIMSNLKQVNVHAWKSAVSAIKSRDRK